jgi:hypothetical protein
VQAQQQLDQINATLDHLIEFLTKLEAVLDRVHVTVKTTDREQTERGS